MRFIVASVETAPVRSGVERENREVGGGRGEDDRVDPVEDAAVAQQDPPGVLHAEVALDHRLEEVAGDRGDDDDAAEEERLPAVYARSARR